MKVSALLPLLISSAHAFTAQPPSHQAGERVTRARSSRISVGGQREATSGSQSGLYRPFVEYAWKKLEHAGILLPSEDGLVPSDLAVNTAVAKGMPAGTVVKISVDAKRGNSPIQYGRYALLETLLPEEDTTIKGIQVLNLVVFGTPPLPVWGVDLVSLPGNRHLLAMDVQPMVASATATETIATTGNDNDDKWKAWHDTHVRDTFEWGGDLPEAASKFFSPHALWTRLSGEDAVETIQTTVFAAFCAHLDLYLECIASSCPEVPVTDNHQAEYLAYRLANDPARPMLQSLYGPEWTERVLEEVLFNKERALP